MTVRILRSLVLMMFLLGHTASVIAAGRTPCERLEHSLMRLSDPDPEECLSGKSLAAVRATPPEGLRLAAVRGLYLDDGSDYEAVDPRQTDVDLDHGSINDHRIGGAIFLSGRISLKGHLRYEPNNGWHWAFVPDERFDRATSALQRTFATIVIDRDDGAPPLSLPKNVALADCWEAKATAHISDIIVLLGESELAGVRPASVRLSGIHDAHPCPSSESTP